MVTIERVDKRSAQGVLRPFLCTAESGTQYFVKGRGAGRSSLIAEWIAGHLGRILNLPIPPVEAVFVPPCLVEGSAVAEIAELGGGFCFGSELVPFAQEFGPAHMEKVPLDLQRAVLVFDWWIFNEDRTMVDGRGNPNLLWNPSAEKMAVIDHNLAFDRDFNEASFWEKHIFRAGRFRFPENKRREWRNFLNAAATQFDAIYSTLPETWHFADSMQTVKADFDFENARKILNRFREDSFWSKFTP